MKSYYCEALCRTPGLVQSGRGTRHASSISFPCRHTAWLESFVRASTRCQHDADVVPGLPPLPKQSFVRMLRDKVALPARAGRARSLRLEFVDRSNAIRRVYSLARLRVYLQADP